ncbi:MAG: AsmA family protein, partial [Methylococcales bacterium]|nr:AsmA family protein [Methylococcales bacterium]
MARLLKIILSIVTAFFLLVIIAAVALPFFIDPNDFKPEIQTAVKESTGRDLVIDGDLELSVFPWIGISTGKLTLSNAKDFSDKPFAEILESNVKVKLLPLFSKKIEISRIVLKGLVLNLAKNKQGKNNWDDLSATEASKNQDGVADNSDKNVVKQDTPEQESISPLAALAIGGISLEQASISWDDQQQDKHTKINDFNLKTDKLVFDQPIAIDLSLTVINKAPELTESIEFSTDLVINEQLNSFKLKKLKLKSETSGKDIPGGKLTATLLADIAIDLAQQTLAISGLKLNTANMVLTADITGTNITDKPTFKGPVNIAEFSPTQLMKELAMPLPVMQDSAALSKLSLGFVIQATSDSADIHNLQLKLDESTMSGSASIKNFSKPKIDFSFNLDTIDVDRYMPPEDNTDDSKEKNKTAKKIAATPAAVAVASTALFPVETLRELNTNGQLTIEKLKINNLTMQGVSIKLNAKNGLIKTQQTIKHFYQGAYTGNTSINVQNKTPSLALNEKLSKVQLEPLLKDMQG